MSLNSLIFHLVKSKTKKAGKKLLAFGLSQAISKSCNGNEQHGESYKALNPCARSSGCKKQLTKVSCLALDT